MKRFFLLILLSISINLCSQNTVGIITNTANAYNSYTLFTAAKNTYLINNCGEVSHKWVSTANSTKNVYLLENGNLLRNTDLVSGSTTLQVPGISGRIELLDWDSNLLWSYEYAANSFAQHHDIYPLPNGNILMMVATVLSESEALQLGRDPSLLPDSVLYNEQILEITPVGTNNASIVWEWNVKDHLIQEFDNTKSNFGTVSQNPQLLNINYVGTSGGKANWLHTNSLQYNASLDQIILSARQLSEFYIIDHSTSTAEAATSTGGTYGKGGDFLYRWGNPAAYNQGTTLNQQLFGQHYPHWIPSGLPDAGKLLIFNNGFGRTPSFSEILKITPPASTPGVYNNVINSAYGPNSPDFNYSASVQTDFYSAVLSSAQQLPNGNILIAKGDVGKIFEIDPDKNIVWEYINPATVSGVIMTQGDDPSIQTRILFRAHKYPLDYPAFTGKTLTPGNPIELNPNTGACQILKTEDETFLNTNISPNPVKDILTIISSIPITKVEIYSPLGKLIKSVSQQKIINLSHLKTGVYFVKIFSSNGVSTKKIIKE